MDRPDGDWDIIHGELITFNDPRFDLPPIDRLEGFNPLGRSMYERVLIAINTGYTVCVSWVYRYGLEHNGRRVNEGMWAP